MDGSAWSLKSWSDVLPYILKNPPKNLVVVRIYDGYIVVKSKVSVDTVDV